MNEKNQSFFMVRNLCPGFSFVRLNLTSYGHLLLQNIASVLNVNNRSSIGSFAGRQIVTRTGSSAAKNLPFFSGLNFRDVSVSPFSSSHQPLVVSSLNASLTAPAYDDKRCTDVD